MARLNPRKLPSAPMAGAPAAQAEEALRLGRIKEAVELYKQFLSRRSRNQKGVRRLSNNQPRLSRAVLDDPPIHIRHGPTILPKNISAATPICAKNITS